MTTEPEGPPGYATPFAGLGASAARQTVTGITADFLIKATEANIQTRLQQRQLGGTAWRQIAADLSSQGGKRECPGWIGAEPGKTLRPWLRTQLHWQVRTP